MDAITYLDYFNELTKKFEILSDVALTRTFNNTVGICNNKTTELVYLKAIENQFKIRKINFKSIGNKHYLSNKNFVVFKDKKLYKISSLKKGDVKKYLLNYLLKKEPTKINLDINIVSYTNKKIQYSLTNKPDLIISLAVKKILATNTSY